MGPVLKKILIGLLILSVFLLIAGLVLFKTQFPAWYFSFFPWLVLIFFLVNSAFILFFYRSLKKPTNEFVRSYMLVTGIKLVIYMILVLVYVLSIPESAVSFAISLALLYIAYTAYDLFTMINLLKQKKENSTFPNHFSN